MSEGWSSVASIFKTLADLKNNSDQIELNEKIHDANLKLQQDTTQKELELKKQNQVLKYNMSGLEGTIRNQTDEINRSLKFLEDYNISYADYQNLPEDLKSPDGSKVFDDKTGAFVGRYKHGIQQASNNIGLLRENQEAVEYNNAILEDLNSLKTRLKRGSALADDIETKFGIEGIQDYSDLGQLVYEKQKEFKYDQKQLTDGAITKPEFDSKWSDYQWITNQSVEYNFYETKDGGETQDINNPDIKVDGNGVPVGIPEKGVYVNVYGPNGIVDSEHVEWQAVYNAMKGKHATWDERIYSHINTIISNRDRDMNKMIQIRQLNGKKLEHQKKINKAINDNKDYILNNIGLHIKESKSDIGKAAKALVSAGKIKNSITGLPVKDSQIGINFSIFGDEGADKVYDATQANIEKEIVDLGLILNNSIKHYQEKSYGMNRSGLIDKMIENGDTKDLAYLIKFGTLPGLVDGHFGQGESKSYWRNSIVLDHMDTGNLAGMFQGTNTDDKSGRAMSRGSVRDYPLNSRYGGLQYDPTQWFGGLHYIADGKGGGTYVQYNPEEHVDGQKVYYDGLVWDVSDLHDGLANDWHIKDENLSEMMLLNDAVTLYLDLSDLRDGNAWETGAFLERDKDGNITGLGYGNQWYEANTMPGYLDELPTYESAIISAGHAADAESEALDIILDQYQEDPLNPNDFRDEEEREQYLRKLYPGI